MRPPPLVAAGLDVAFVNSSSGRSVNLGGLAVIFGTFPANLDEFLSLARLRLHLGAEQARELDPVLNTRVMALWAWLPTRGQDCYLEYDRATGTEQCWLIGPEAGACRAVDVAADADQLDRAFLDALVLNGPGHWGGESGLERLVERHGQRPLLVAAQVADALEHRPKEPRRALRLAQTHWPDLTSADDAAWLALAADENPWIGVQLGRLALRLGHLHAARRLLALSDDITATGVDSAPVAQFDLGQACEALSDLPAAEAAFTRFAAARPTDPDGWRRLLLVRLRLSQWSAADEALRRYRGAGGRERDLAERFVTTVARGRLRLKERAGLATWLSARVWAACDEALTLEAAIETAAARLRDDNEVAGVSGSAEQRLHDLLTRARAEFHAELLNTGDPADVERLVVQALRAVLLALPFAGVAHREDREREPSDLAELVAEALTRWSHWRLKTPRPFTHHLGWLTPLVALAINARPPRRR